MIRQDINIARLILEYLKGNCSREEEEELFRWLDASDNNRRLFHRLLISRNLPDKGDVYRRFDRYYNFEAIRRKIRSKSFHIGKWVTAAAVFLCIAVAAAVFFQRQNKLPDEMTQIVSLSPGNKAAILVLPDGREEKLDARLTVISEHNRSIHNQNGRIVYSGPKSEDGDTAEIYHEIKVPRGGEYQVELSDGTRVWLNSESTIYYPLEFKKSERHVRISGEVYLKVAKDSLHPFVVCSKHMQVRVLGTEFNLRDYPEEENVMATLVEGTVAVAVPHGEVSVLKPSEQWVCNPFSGENKIIRVDTEMFISWKDGVYLFRRQRLEDILNLISRWYDVEIVYRNPEVKDILFSGRLKRYENAGNLLEAFEKVGGVKFSVEGKMILVMAE